ncbi:MAG: hypothetical protein LBC99_05835 [Spirochaetota bacterium]|jgi:hypothetical protein|nr:hypothetical protein [Spirochaetota bacterium]
MRIRSVFPISLVLFLICISGAALFADEGIAYMPSDTVCAIPDPFDADEFQNTRIIVPLSWREVIVEVYSESASFLVRLKEEEAEPGEYLWRWNGCDDEGRVLSPGVYFLRVRYIIGENMENCVFPLRLLRSASSSRFHKSE